MTWQEDLLWRVFDWLIDDETRVQAEYVKDPKTIDEAVDAVVAYMEVSKPASSGLDQRQRPARSVQMVAPTLVHYREEAPTRLVTDASPVGLGPVLEQQQPDGNCRPDYYASRSLTPVERWYAQFEKEALAVVWGVEHHHLYLLGTHLDILTDTKLLVSAYGPHGNPPARVLNFALRLQPYDYSIRHIDRRPNVADYLSRQPLVSEDICYHIATEEFVRSILVGAVLPACEVEQALEK